jgi:hypothetical protein
MNTAISALEIPQGASELTLNELKLISGGWDDDGAGCAPVCPTRRKLKLEKVIVIKVFKSKHKKPCVSPCDGNDN